MKFFYLLMMLPLIALTGCAAGGGVSGSDTGGPVGPIPTLTSLVIEVTLVPAETATPTPTAAPNAAAMLLATATVAQSTGGNPAPASALPVQGFTECALTPGWVGCDPSAPRVAGRLAFVDPAGARVIVLDLETGDSWQVSSHPGRLAWSPDGSQLLLAHPTEGGTTYELYSAEGVPLDPPATDEELVWQPDGTLDSIMAVHAPDGDIARLEFTPDTRWLLRVQPVGGEERVIDVEPQPTDRMYLPVAWVPGQQQIIVQRYFAGNAALLTGTELLTIDTETGEQQPLEPSAPVGGQAGFAWQPQGQGLQQMPAQLALNAVLGGGRPSSTLALIDFSTMQARYPLPEGITMGGLAWLPQGDRLVFAANPRQATGEYTVPGIYQLDPATDAVQRLTEPTTNLFDAWPNLTAAGDVLVFTRAGSLPTGALRLDVMGKRLADGSEWVIVRELTVPGDGMVLPWDRYLAFGIK